MDTVATFPARDRQTLFQETATRRGLSLAVIEKDFWVCWALRRAFAMPGLGEQLIFKGGTSLSKVFGLIERFSEDIDLSIRRDYLGAVGDKDPEQEGISGTQRSRRVAVLRETCRRTVQEQMLPALRASFADYLGPEAGEQETGNTAWRLYPDPHEEGTLLFAYPSVQPAAPVPAYILPQVKLEMGAGSDPYPIGRYPVTSYAAETFPQVFAEPQTTVIALEAERTFWEKATLLHAECHRPADKSFPVRLSRHYYDLMRLSQAPEGKRALVDHALRERVVRHKMTYFASAWASYETAHPGTFRLLPGEDRMSGLRQDYSRMRDMVFAHVPAFDEMMAVIASLEAEINAGP